MGKSLVTDVLADSDPLPAWLEAAAPLKGRWLRLFLIAPILALILVFVFSIVLYILGLLLVVTVVGFLGSAILHALGGS